MDSGRRTAKGMTPVCYTNLHAPKRCNWFLSVLNVAGMATPERCIWTGPKPSAQMPFMQQPDILALGEPLIEMIRLPPQQDGTVLYKQGIGGDTLTAAVHAARAGAQVGYLSAVGDDAPGDEICAFCEAERIDTTHLLRRSADPTGLNVIDPDPVAR